MVREGTRRTEETRGREAEDSLDSGRGMCEYSETSSGGMGPLRERAESATQLFSVSFSVLEEVLLSEEVNGSAKTIIFGSCRSACVSGSTSLV